MEQYPVEVIGVYETKSDQNTASLFVTDHVLKEIQELMQTDFDIYGLDVYLEPGSEMESVSGKIEQPGLETVYRQKPARGSLKNISSLTLIIKISS